MHRNRLMLRVSFGALVFAFAAPCAKAQEALPAIDIGGAAPATNPAPSPAPATAPADGPGSLTVPSVAEQKRETLSTVGSVAFVDTNTPEIQTRSLDDLRDLLKDVPGVYADSRYGDELRLSVRGSGLGRPYHLRGLELQQDGTPMNNFDGAGDFYQVDPNYYRSIEVLKGGNALSAGASTLGGVVNFVSPTAYTATSPNLVAVEAGSFNSIKGQVQVSRVLGDFDFLVNGTFSHSDGFREHSVSDYTKINGNFGYRFSPNVETRFYFGVYDTWQQLPGTLTLSETLNNPTLSTAPWIAGYGPNGFEGNQARDVKNQRISNKTTIETDYGRLEFNSWFMHDDVYHPVFVIIEQNGETWGFAPKFTTKFNVADHRDDLIVGGRVWGGSSSDNWFVNYNGAAANPYGLVPANFANAAYSFPPYTYNGLAQFGAANSCFGYCGLFINPGIDAQVRNNRMSSLNLESYFENQFYITPQFLLMTGAKYFSDTRAYTELGGVPFEPLSGFQEKVYHAIVPKVGLMFEPERNMQFFADITGSRDVPDFIDLTQGNFPPPPNGQSFTPLSAQKAWTGEIGSRGKWDRFAWDVTFYHSEVMDEMIQFNTLPTSNSPSAFNVPHTMHQGVELTASADLLRDITAPNAGDKLKLTQVWTWNDFRFENDPTFGNNPLAGIPRHVLRTTLAYSRPDGFYFAPAIDWVPQGVYIDYAHTMEAPGYVLLGAQAGLKLPQGVSFYVDARNLTNQHYVSDVTTIADARSYVLTYGASPQWFYSGVGRSVRAGMKMAF